MAETEMSLRWSSFYYIRTTDKSYYNSPTNIV